MGMLIVLPIVQDNLPSIPVHVLLGSPLVTPSRCCTSLSSTHGKDSWMYVRSFAFFYMNRLLWLSHLFVHFLLGCFPFFLLFSLRASISFLALPVAFLHFCIKSLFLFLELDYFLYPIFLWLSSKAFLPQSCCYNGVFRQWGFDNLLVTFSKSSPVQ